MRKHNNPTDSLRPGQLDRIINKVKPEYVDLSSDKAEEVMTMGVLGSGKKEDADGLVELLEWNRSTSFIETVDGNITYREWIDKEAVRIGKAPGRTVMVKTRPLFNGGEEVSLWVNDVGES